MTFCLPKGIFWHEKATIIWKSSTVVKRSQRWHSEIWRNNNWSETKRSNQVKQISYWSTLKANVLNKVGSKPSLEDFEVFFTIRKKPHLGRCSLQIRDPITPKWSLHLTMHFSFYLGFLSWSFTNHRTAGEGGQHFFNS